MKTYQKILYIITLLTVCSISIALTAACFVFLSPLVILPCTIAGLSIMAIGQQILEHYNKRKENYKINENKSLLTAKKNVPIIPILDFSNLPNFKPNTFSFFRKSTYTPNEKLINDQNTLLNNGENYAPKKR